MPSRFISVLLILFLMTGCQPAGSPATTTPHKTPVAQIKSVSPAEAKTSEAVVFDGTGDTWNGRVTAYKWRSGLDGNLSDKAGFTTKTLSEGKHKIFFSIQDDSGATTVSIDQGIGSVGLEGKRTISPKISTRYTLTATNAAGDVTATANIIVVPIANTGLPVIRSFAADPGSVAPGTSAVLRWEVSNADAVKIDPNVGFFSPIGSAKITPKATTSYTLTAYNGIGIVIGTTQILVQQEQRRRDNSMAGITIPRPA